jgi:hypothetical protein
MKFLLFCPRLVFLILIGGCSTTVFAAVTNPPPGGILVNAVRATAAPKKIAVTEKTSAVETNSTTKTRFVVGVSNPVRQEIRLENDSAVADYGLQKVYFPADITEAPITIITPDGRKLFCRATFLALHDATTGQSLMLGEVRKSVGELVGDNTVIYPNAFDTISADIRYRYTKYSLEQDIILHEGVKLPTEFQSENVRLEVWSEWIDSTPDAKETQTIDLRPLAATGKQAAVENTDEQLKFGASRIGDGYAFGIQSENEKTPVAKMFTRIEGRNWLIERVDYTALKPPQQIGAFAASQSNAEVIQQNETDGIRAIFKQKQSRVGLRDCEFRACACECRQLVAGWRQCRGRRHRKSQ